MLLYRRTRGPLELLLVHPGGPFWAKKDDHAWTIPKGEFDDEDPLAAARRELTEETGIVAMGEPQPLVPVKQPSGKIVHAFALEQDADLGAFRSNTFSLEWPPRSGRISEYPEVDRAEWFGLDEARRKLQTGQVDLLDQLLALRASAP